MLLLQNPSQRSLEFLRRRSPGRRGQRPGWLWLLPASFSQRHEARTRKERNSLLFPSRARTPTNHAIKTLFATRVDFGFVNSVANVPCGRRMQLPSYDSLSYFLAERRPLLAG